MKYNTNCPQCNSTISFWRIMLAKTPSQLKCPHCKAKLMLEHRFVRNITILQGIVVFFAVALMFMGIASFLIMSPQIKAMLMHKPNNAQDILTLSWMLLRFSFVYILVPIFFLVIITELLTSLYIVNKKPFRTPEQMKEDIHKGKKYKRSVVHVLMLPAYAAMFASLGILYMTSEGWMVLGILGLFVGATWLYNFFWHLRNPYISTTKDDIVMRIAPLRNIKKLSWKQIQSIDKITKRKVILSYFKSPSVTKKLKISLSLIDYQERENFISELKNRIKNTKEAGVDAYTD